LIELPLSLISVSLGTALLPVLSGFLARGDKHKMSETAQHYLELNLLMTMASAAGLYSLAHPIVQLLFGRGHFKASDVLMTSQILQTYCWIMIFSSGVRVLTPAYYAVKNTWMPALISAICLAVHMVIAPLLMAQLQVHGLMLSTILSAFLNFVLLFVFFPKFVTSFQYLGFFKNMMKFAVLSLITGAVSQIFYVIYPLMMAGFWGLLLSLLVSVGLAVLAFVFAGPFLRVHLIQEIVQKVQKKIKSRVK